MDCPVCGSKNTPLDNHLPEVRLYHCNMCMHRFTDPMSINDKEKYSEEYYLEKHRKWFKNPNIELFDYLNNKIVEHNPDASVIDVGCGDGAFLKFLKKSSPKLKFTGVDYHNNISSERIKYYKGDIFDIHFEEKFDVVVNLAVIEHVWDVHGFIQKVSSLCQTDGLIMTMTVNDQSLIYKVSRLANKLGSNSAYQRLYEKHHLNHFSKESLRWLLESEGLNTVDHYCHVPKMKSIDMPQTSNKLSEFANTVGLVSLLTAEKITKETILQTITSKRV